MEVQAPSQADLDQHGDFLALFLTGAHEVRELLDAASPAQLNLLVKMVATAVFSQDGEGFDQAKRALLLCQNPAQNWLNFHTVPHLLNRPDQSKTALLSVDSSLEHVVQAYCRSSDLRLQHPAARPRWLGTGSGNKENAPRPASQERDANNDAEFVRPENRHFGQELENRGRSPRN